MIDDDSEMRKMQSNVTALNWIAQAVLKGRMYMAENFRLVTVDEAAPKLGRSRQGLYRDIRENQFPFPNAVVKFGKSLRINLSLIEKTMEQQSVAVQKAAA